MNPDAQRESRGFNLAAQALFLCWLLAVNALYYWQFRDLLIGKATPLLWFWR